MKCKNVRRRHTCEMSGEIEVPVGASTHSRPAVNLPALTFRHKLNSTTEIALKCDHDSSYSTSCLRMSFKYIIHKRLQNCFYVGHDFFDFFAFSVAVLATRGGLILLVFTRWLGSSAVKEARGSGTEACWVFGHRPSAGAIRKSTCGARAVSPLAWPRPHLRMQSLHWPSDFWGGCD